MSDLSDDPKVMELEQKFGDTGFTIFVKLIEMIAKMSPNNTNDPEFGKAVITVETLEKKLGNRKYKDLQPILRFLARRELMSFTKRANWLHISFPKMADIKDNTAKSL